MSESLDFSEEIALIERLKNNDIGAFDQLFWHYQKAIFMNVLKITKDNGIAEDIVQEVFSVLWQKRGSLDKDRSLGGWLFISSYNRALNVLKKKTRETVFFSETTLDTLSEEIEEDITEIQLNILENAVNQLSPQRRRVFELCKIQGQTYEQTAKMMGISKHTVKEYLSSAIAQIKAYAQQSPDKLAAATLIVILQNY